MIIALTTSFTPIALLFLLSWTVLVGVGRYRVEVVVGVAGGRLEVALPGVIVSILPLNSIFVLIFGISVHVGPGILVIRISTAHINVVLSLSIHTRDERHSQHFKVRSQVEHLVSHHPIEVAVDPLYAFHGTWTLGVGLLSGWGKRLLLIRLLLNRPRLLLYRSRLLLCRLSRLLLYGSRLLLYRSRLLLYGSRLLLYRSRLLLCRLSRLLLYRSRLLLDRPRLLLYWSRLLLCRLSRLLLYWSRLLLCRLSRLLLYWSRLLLGRLSRIRGLHWSNRSCSLTNIGAAIKAAKSVTNAIHISLTYTPTV